MGSPEMSWNTLPAMVFDGVWSYGVAMSRGSYFLSPWLAVTMREGVGWRPFFVHPSAASGVRFDGPPSSGRGRIAAV
jgi:hypothetical protein